ncbi:lipoate--protein ligase [Jeotgalicoccus huakuii]|nr:lipoate--protein ligase [Jeotgalicoccus huakuii]
MYLIEMKRNGEYVFDGAMALCVQVYAQENLFFGEDILFPYITEPLVQVGRYQNAREEVNLPYIQKNNINLVRRDTGGGTIYLDKDCVNFCFLKESENQNSDVNFDDMYRPVIEILNEFGVENVQKSGRNDLEIDGKKVSGAAMSIVNGRQYGGYSLLLDIDETAISNALKPNRLKLDSKGIKSVRSRVHSLRPYLSQKYKSLTSVEFSELMILKIFGVSSKKGIKTYELTDEDWSNIDQMMERKYLNWDWNYGKTPSYSYSKSDRFSIGTVEISLDVEHETIKQAKIYGDFFGSKDTETVESALTGVRLKEDNLMRALENIDLKECLGDIKVSEFVGLILG